MADDWTSLTPAQHKAAMAVAPQPQPSAPPQTADWTSLTPAQHQAALQNSDSLLDKIKSGAQQAASGLDWTFGASPRAAAMALAKGENPLLAFIDQYGKTPDTAPTGEQIAAQIGASTAKRPIYDESKSLGINGPHMESNAESLGLPLDTGLNLLNVIPGLGGAGKVAEDIAASGTPVVSTVAKGAKALINAPETLAESTAEHLTTVPKKAIQVYGERGNEVKDLIEKHGGYMSSAGDEMKAKVSKSIADTKAPLQQAIENDLNNPEIQPAPAQPIIDKLQARKAKLNPHYDAGDIAQIDEMINAVQSTAKDGMLSPRDLFATKNYLQTQSNGSFIKNGQLFSSGPKASQAANDARAVAKDMLHERAPGIQGADSVYENLHRLDDQMKASLLAEGKSENAFAGAGGGKGNSDQLMLKKIGQATNTEPLKDAELLFTAKQFNDTPTARKKVLQALLDTKRRVYNPIPTGAPSGLENFFQMSMKPEDRQNLINRLSGQSVDDQLKQRLGIGGNPQ